MKLNQIDRLHMAPSTEDIPIQIRGAKYQYARPRLTSVAIEACFATSCRTGSTTMEKRQACYIRFNSLAFPNSGRS